MSQTRTFSAVAVFAVWCGLTPGALPAEPQTANDGPGVSVDMNGARVIHKTSVAYPREAVARHIQGTVVAQVRLDADGNVVDASIVSGPDELRRAVLESVLDWHFSRTAALSSRQVMVTFALPDQTEFRPNRVVGGQFGLTPGVVTNGGPQPIVIRRIAVIGLSDDDRAELMSRLPVHEGDTVGSSQAQAIEQSVRDFDEHLVCSLRRTPEGEMSIVISVLQTRTPSTMVPLAALGTAAAQGNPPGAAPIRVGGQVSKANLLSQVEPIYPPLAIQARVQGTVTFEALIGKDGHVQNLHLVSGHPLLVRPAMEAAQKRVYRPTLLNGNPVEVITTIEISFTLPE